MNSAALLLVFLRLCLISVSLVFQVIDEKKIFSALKQAVFLALQKTPPDIEELKSLKSGFEALVVVAAIDTRLLVCDSALLNEARDLVQVIDFMTVPNKGGDTNDVF